MSGNANYRDTLNGGWAVPPFQDATVLAALVALTGGILAGLALTVRRIVK